MNIGFSAESPEEYTKWTGLLLHTANMDGAIQTMRLGGDVAAEIKQFRLNVKNRRMKVGEDKKLGRPQLELILHCPFLGL